MCLAFAIKVTKLYLLKLVSLSSAELFDMKMYKC